MANEVTTCCRSTTPKPSGCCYGDGNLNTHNIGIPLRAFGTSKVRGTGRRPLWRATTHPKKRLTAQHAEIELSALTPANASTAVSNDLAVLNDTNWQTGRHTVNADQSNGQMALHHQGRPNPKLRPPYTPTVAETHY